MKLYKLAFAVVKGGVVESERVSLQLVLIIRILHKDFATGAFHCTKTLRKIKVDVARNWVR